jgi:deferrochelatase/peroxidase EfeB
LGEDPTKFASMLVGRWPSGAPLMRTPAADNPALGDDGFANNHFLFDDNTRPSDLRTIPGYSGDSFPPAMADFLATVCPHFAHIRKINPRDSVTDLGKPEDNLARLILRRGIPYGQHVIGVKRPGSKLHEQDRGLMFLSYMGSIEDQFEFLQRRWANSPVQPNFGGHDPIIGQNGTSSGRVRELDFPTPTGSVKIKYKEEWVIPTGGGYFFSPTISAIMNVLAS